MKHSMYKFCDNVIVRNCDELSFLVNISDNSLFVIKTNTLKFLQIKLEEGLIIDKRSNLESDFIKFIKELEKKNILEVAINEI